MASCLLAAEAVVVEIPLLFLRQMVALAAEGTAVALIILVMPLLAKKIQVEAAVAFSTMRQTYFAILVLVAPVLSLYAFHKEV
mgnify:CR=1 FL=1